MRAASTSPRGGLRRYGGKRVVLGYARWFGVDRTCAILELRMLGVIVPERELAAAAAALAATRVRRTPVRGDADRTMDEDFDFAGEDVSLACPQSGEW